jgi:hypothetical protein
MEVPSPSFLITQVQPVIKIKAQNVKNKNLKPKGTVTYSRQNFK